LVKPEEARLRILRSPGPPPRFQVFAERGNDALAVNGRILDLKNLVSRIRIRDPLLLRLRQFPAASSIQESALRSGSSCERRRVEPLLSEKRSELIDQSAEIVWHENLLAPLS